jgi:DNA-binding CsgD family transcriptional regulator
MSKDTARILTDREREILTLIAKGNTNKDIARLLGIGDETVKFHIANMLHKLRARSRAHAVAIAYHILD